MTHAYSQDLRARALACADRGETTRSIAAALQISPSCVSKWKKLRRETGDLKPGKMNGHKRRVLSGPYAEWLRERTSSGPFTLRKLTVELAARGIKTHQKAIWIFVHAEGLSFKKNRAGDATVTSGYRPQTSTLENPSAQD
jgi:transposase